MSRLELIEERHLTFQAAYLQYWIQFPPQDAEDLWREDTEEFIEAHAAEPIAVTDDGQFVYVPSGTQFGDFDLTIQFFTEPPGEEEGGWSSTPEVNVTIDRTLTLMDPDDHQVDIPVPYHHSEPAPCRLRVLYRGRSEDSHEHYQRQEVGDLEENVVQIWPPA